MTCEYKVLLDILVDIDTFFSSVTVLYLKMCSTEDKREDRGEVRSGFCQKRAPAIANLGTTLDLPMYLLNEIQKIA